MRALGVMLMFGAAGLATVSLGSVLMMLGYFE